MSGVPRLGSSNHPLILPSGTLGRLTERLLGVLASDQDTHVLLAPQQGSTV